MNRIPLFSLSLLTAFLAGCQVSLWAGDVNDPYELHLPPPADAAPTPVPTPAP